jgi:exodeoxyribonuclease VII small subunit
MAKTPQKLSEHSFESALERLEHIVEEMEGDRLPLEELLGRYEEGTRLVKVCQDRIGAAEKRIELIAKNASGAAELTGFDPSTVAAEPSAPAAVPAPVAGPRASSSRRGDSDEVSLF